MVSETVRRVCRRPLVAAALALISTPAAACESRPPEPVPSGATSVEPATAATSVPAVTDAEAGSTSEPSLVPVVDLHVDTIYQAVRSGRSVVGSTGKGDLDVARLRAGGYVAQVFAIWVPARIGAEGGADASRAFADRAYGAFRTLLAAAAADLEQARSAADLERIRESGRIAALLSIEGAHAIGGDPAALDVWAERGLRMLGLTWNNSNAFAEAAADPRPEAPGLTEAGRALVARAEAAGILLDISHASAATVSDVLEIATRPVVASHSSVAALRGHSRNLTDDQLRAMAATGGVVGINFHSPFLRAAKKGRATVSDVADHVLHAVRIAGVDHVGLGSDFDGMIKKPVGLEGPEGMPALAEELRRRGLSDSDVRKVMGGNAWRVLTLER